MAKFDKVLGFFDLNNGEDYDDPRDEYENDEVEEEYEDETDSEYEGEHKNSEGFFGRIKDFVSGRNDSEDDSVYEPDDEAAVPERNTDVPRRSSGRSSERSSGRQYVTRDRNSSTGKVVALVHSGQEVNVVETVRPKSIDDSPRIIDLLKDGKPVVVSFEGIETSERQRIIDVVSGGSYAVNGKYCSVSKNIFIFAPENVEIKGDFINDSEKDDFPLMDGREEY